MSPDWQRRRSGFNHDWLKNRFHTGISSFINILDDRIEDTEAERRFLLVTLAQWPGRAREAAEIVSDFETEMSPKALFRQPPLSRCSLETLAWLPDMVDLLWRRRLGVDGLCAASREALARADHAYAEVARAVEACQGAPSAQALRPHREQFESFRVACGKVSESISRFPDRIMVT